MGVARKKVLSKYVGVTRSSRKKGGATGRWMVFTGGGDNLKWHGCFDTEREAARARNKAMIERFGFDPNPNVIEGSDESVTKYSVSGDTEFIIRAVNHMRLRGNGNLYIRNRVGESPYALKERIRGLQPLLLAQPYILDLEIHSEKICDVDLNECTLDIGGPWLTVPEITGDRKVVFHRKQSFKSVPDDVVMGWREIAGRFNGQYAFVGNKSEAQILRTLTQLINMPVMHAKNLLQAAQFIAGAELFVGNKSVMSQIAIGLGIKTVIEGTKEFDDLAKPVSPKQSSTVREGEQCPESHNA